VLDSDLELTYITEKAAPILRQLLQPQRTLSTISSNSANNSQRVDFAFEFPYTTSNGKGTDLVIGCGNNIDATEGTTAGMTTVAKKAIGAPFVAASGRYVALIHENPLARNVFDTYFVTAE
jgi:hypothetical protein